MRVLVTGAGGFVGREIVARLLASLPATLVIHWCAQRRWRAGSTR